jgi:hypothetical protein
MWSIEMSKGISVMAGFVFGFCLVVVGSGCNLSVEPVSVTVTEIGTCTDYDRSTKQPIGVTSEFRPDAEQIMVYFYAKTNLEAEVTYRWYLESDAVVEFEVPLDPGYNFGWIGSTDTFPEGNYTVEILLDEGLLRSTTFRVVAPSS